MAGMMDSGLDEATFARLAREYQERWALPLLACRPDGVITAGAGDDAPAACADRDLAVAEALRWGAPTFVLTAGDEVLFAMPVMHNAQLRGGLLVYMSAAAATGPNLQRAAADLRRLAEEANVTNAALLEARRLAEGRERERAEAIHALKGVPAYDLRRMFLLEEPALASAVRRGDRFEARGILNRLLVGIHACAGERMAVLKSFYAELVVTLSRTAVWAGAAPDAVLPANFAGLARLAAIDDEPELAHWLREQLEMALAAADVGRRQDDTAALADAVHYLEAHLAEDLTRDELAKVACLSPSHFSRRLKERLGCTFTELLARVRIARAAELLARTDKPLGLVARESGFNDPSYFTKVFFRLRGATPRAYRAAQRRPAS